jgi:hypothetical protein
VSPELGPEDTPALATCPICQTDFAPAPRQLYCSPRCKILARRTEPATPQAHTCPVCNGVFTANPRARQVYCSPDCRREAERQRNQHRNEQRAIRLGEQPRHALSPTPPAPALRQDDPLAPTAVRNCPHCDKPVTIVALLATPEAARPVIPTTAPDVIPMRRL